MEEFSRTKIVLGEKEKNIQNANIAILGVGGVGGYVFEMLVRLGVKNLTVVDCDIFEKSNLNRQILATEKTLNFKKVEIAKKRAEVINKNCTVCAKNIKLSKDNIETILTEKYDYVLDCIDDVSAKIAVIKFCHENKLPLLCAMGTGNRYKSPNFVVCDIFKTQYDGLARKMRNELKKQGMNFPVNVCCTNQPAEKTQALGSVVYYPAMCACQMVSFVVNELI